MEYVDGEDLASLIRRIGRFPAGSRDGARASDVCRLAAAHDRGVVHRDLKPANIMLDGNGTIRITDFGLAGAAGESLRAGTPAYMSPEQLAGGEVTPRSDLYALGLVLYELFTGHRALEGSNLAELIRQARTGGYHAALRVVRDLDPSIERAIMRCLDPDAAKRPSSALAVAASLPGGDPLAAALAAGRNALARNGRGRGRDQRAGTSPGRRGSRGGARPSRAVGGPGRFAFLPRMSCRFRSRR
jgi:serine/threonine-protein kinase